MARQWVPGREQSGHQLIVFGGPTRNLRHYVATAHGYRITGLRKFVGNSVRYGLDGRRDQRDFDTKPGCRDWLEPKIRAQTIE
jgi:hypothetical protein